MPDINNLTQICQFRHFTIPVSSRSRPNSVLCVSSVKNFFMDTFRDIFGEFSSKLQRIFWSLCPSDRIKRVLTPLDGTEQSQLTVIFFLFQIYGSSHYSCPILLLMIKFFSCLAKMHFSFQTIAYNIRVTVCKWAINHQRIW